MESKKTENSNGLHEVGVKPGIYVALKVSKESGAQVFGFCEQDLHMDMSDSDSPYAKVRSDMHTTLLASKDAKNQNLESVRNHLEDEQKLFKAKPSHWEILTSPNTGKKILILKLESKEIDDLHKKLREETNLNHSFEDYKIHVSVHYNYNGELPTKLPNFEIVFNETHVKDYLFKQSPPPPVEVSEVPKVDLPSEQKSKSLDLSNVLNNIRTIKEVSSRGDESVIKQESQPITKKKFN
jgi:hypothetical protein